MGAEQYINGGKKYTWGDGTNGCSPKQEYIVELIYERLKLRPSSDNVKVVYDFINKNYTKAGLHGMKFPKHVMDKHRVYQQNKKNR